MTLGMALLFTLQGIPSLYYGTEAGLSGTMAADGSRISGEGVEPRSAVGKPVAFDTGSEPFDEIATMSRLRAEASRRSRYGRLYFRELSANGTDFGHSSAVGGVVAFSRILVDREVLVVANTNASINFTGSVLRDRTSEQAR